MKKRCRVIELPIELLVPDGLDPTERFQVLFFLLQTFLCVALGRFLELEQCDTHSSTSRQSTGQYSSAVDAPIYHNIISLITLSSNHSMV
jgi:hypothetical protein